VVKLLVKDIEVSGSPLDKILNPRSIAFLGGSNSIENIGTSQLLNIIKGGYQGKVYPVHPREKEIMGLKAYLSVTDLPEPADVAVMVIPNTAVPEALEQCGKKGIRGAIIITAGYEEMGPEGRRLQDHLVQIARKHGIRFLGPNCIGIINSEIGLNTTWFAHLYKPGHVGIASQSGSYVTQTLPYFANLGLGLSKAISVGNQADIDMVDCLEYLGADPQTRAIALYIEGLKRPRQFMEVARKITPRKPVVAIYVGGTDAGRRASLSHTGSISGPDELYDGLFRQCGILRAWTLTDLFDWALALAQQPLPSNNRIIVLSNSGGPATSTADECNRQGLEVPPFDIEIQKKIRAITPLTASPKNPIDITMNYDLELIFKKLPELTLQLDQYDGMLFYGIFGPIHFEHKIKMADRSIEIPLDFFRNWMLEVCEAFVEIPEKYRKPIICSCFCGREDEAVAFLQDHGIPVYPAPERAVRAMAALWRYKQIKDNFKLSGNTR